MSTEIFLEPDNNQTSLLDCLSPFKREKASALNMWREIKGSLRSLPCEQAQQKISALDEAGFSRLADRACAMIDFRDYTEILPEFADRIARGLMRPAMIQRYIDLDRYQCILNMDSATHKLITAREIYESYTIRTAIKSVALKAEREGLIPHHRYKDLAEKNGLPADMSISFIAENIDRPYVIRLAKKLLELALFGEGTEKRWCDFALSRRSTERILKESFDLYENGAFVRAQRNREYIDGA